MTRKRGYPNEGCKGVCEGGDISSGGRTAGSGLSHAGVRDYAGGFVAHALGWSLNVHLLGKNDGRPSGPMHVASSLQLPTTSISIEMIDKEWSQSHYYRSLFLLK